MTLQPVHAIAPDVELWATGYLRAALAPRLEPYVQGVWVDNKKPTTAHARLVAVRRDGGPRQGVFDNPNLTVRVWADDEQECADLARLTQGVFLAAAGNGPVVRVLSRLGPTPIPDESEQFQRYMTFELRTRLSALT